MTNQDTQTIGDEGAALGGAIAPSSRSGARRREPVIQIRAYRRPIGSEEASSPEDDVPVSIGELAVKIVRTLHGARSQPVCMLRQLLPYR